MILDNHFRVRAFSVFLIVMVFVSAIYLLLVIPPQKRFRNLQISKRHDEQKTYVTQRIKQSNELYREKIRHFITNQGIAFAFSQGNSDLLKKEVQPFMAILEMEQPYYFIINFFTSDNRPFLLMQGMKDVEKPETGLDYVKLTNEYQKSHFGYEIFGNSLFYKIVRPVFYDNRYIGCVEFGIRDTEIIELLKKDYKILPAAYFRNSEFKDSNWQNLEWDFVSENAFYTYYDEQALLGKALISNEDMQGRLVKSGSRSYYFSNFGEFRDYADNLLGGLFAGFEITDINKSYTDFLKYQFAGIILFTLIVLIIFYLFFGYFFEKIYDLKKTLDKRIAERSREIIDTSNQLNQIFNTTTNAMRLIDKDFNILKVNHAFAGISGYSIAEVEGKKCYDVFPGDKCHTENCSLTRILQGEEKIEFRTENKNRNGNTVPLIQTAVPLRGNDGQIYGIIEDLKDLTELIKTEEALQQSEKDFSMFMDDLPLGVFIKDKDSRALYLNKYMDGVFGKANCLSKRPGDIFPSAIARRVLNEDSRVLKGEAIVVEEALQDKQGRERIYMTHKFLLRDPRRGDRIGGISIDITQKKEAEKQINLLSRAVQFTPVCVVITNVEGEIEYVNHAFQTLTGYTFEEVAGENINILGSGIHDEKFFEDMWKSIKAGNDWQGQVQNKRKNGEIYWERLSISPVKNSEGHVKHYIAVKEDNTKQKEFEEELNEAKEKALESDRLKTAFLTNFSHEIRTPMNAIVGLTEIIVNTEVPATEKKEFSEIIQENSRSLLKLIDDIIDISRIDAGFVDLNESPCYINLLLNEIYDEFANEKIIGKKPSVKLKMKKANPSSDFAIRADKERLKQVLINLVENAVKFTEKGIVEFGYVLKDENTILFFVRDTGVGIPEDKLDTVFERFKSVDETLTRNHRGTGLGLAISKSIVELMSGRIWVRSNPNQGSTFFFTLPFIITVSEEELHAGMGKVPLLPQLEGKTILVADEINANFLLVEAALKKNTANILWAKNGKEAIDLVKQNKTIDLVLLDVELPVVSGIDALTEIKRFRSNLPVLMQTAFSVPEQIENCIQCGCDGYIFKPINIRQLINKMGDCLGNT